MNVYIALLRGINVGGKSLPMKELVSVLESLGCRNVRTHIQSGNVVFENAEDDRGRLSQAITAEIDKRRGFAPYVLLLTPADIERAITENPFPEAASDPAHLHLGFLGAETSNPDLKKLENMASASERFHLTARVFYLHAPDGVGRSKLAAGVERLLGVPLTDRNWTTILKLREMAGEPGLAHEPGGLEDHAKEKGRE